MQDYFYLKATGAASVGLGLTISDINQYLELLGGVGTLVVMGITVLRYLKEQKEDK